GKAVGLAFLAAYCATHPLDCTVLLPSGGPVSGSAAPMAGSDADNLIKHLDLHIRKMTDTCPSGSPDPNDPKHDPVNGWKDEIKAAIKNLKQKLKRTPNNKAKRAPIEDAIKRGESTVDGWQE